MLQPDKPNLFVRVWRFFRGGAASRHPEVFVHDPAGAMPHNLDDPFHDAEENGDQVVTHAVWRAQ